MIQIESLTDGKEVGFKKRKLKGGAGREGMTQKKRAIKKTSSDGDDH